MKSMDHRRSIHRHSLDEGYDQLRFMSHAINFDTEQRLQTLDDGIENYELHCTNNVFSKSGLQQQLTDTSSAPSDSDEEDPLRLNARSVSTGVKYSSLRARS